MIPAEVLPNDSEALLSTHVFPPLNRIEGEFRAARIHHQTITWGTSANDSPVQIFNILTLNATCSCKYHLKMTEEKTNQERNYCNHIIGQLRRVIFSDRWIHESAPAHPADPKKC